MNWFCLQYSKHSIIIMMNQFFELSSTSYMLFQSNYKLERVEKSLKNSDCNKYSRVISMEIEIIIAIEQNRNFHRFRRSSRGLQKSFLILKFCGTFSHLEIWAIVDVGIPLENLMIILTLEFRIFSRKNFHSIASDKYGDVAVQFVVCARDA